MYLTYGLVAKLAARVSLRDLWGNPCRFESGQGHVKSGLDCLGFNPDP